MQCTDLTQHASSRSQRECRSQKRRAVGNADYSDGTVLLRRTRHNQPYDRGIKAHNRVPELIARARPAGTGSK